MPWSKTVLAWLVLILWTAWDWAEVRGGVVLRSVGFCGSVKVFNVNVAGSLD